MPARSYFLERVAIFAAAVALAAFSQACVADEPELKSYSCAVLYRCAGDEFIKARVGLSCGASEEEAEENIANHVMQALEDSDCEWQYVRPLCEPYEPDACGATL